MAVFQEPTQWDHELGNNADVSTLPDDTSATTGVASLQKLFQIINQTPLEAGGVAPDREDFNALFKILGDSVFYGMNGGLASYNPAYDYVVGRYVVYNNTLYKCIQANGASSTVVAPDSVSPLGSDYWKDIENQDNTSLIPNQIIQSPVPLTDANLHLLDGALLSGSGAYSEYVTMMGALHDADPTANIWTDEATWQATVTSTGSCGKFVYDSVNNTLRLPKYDARYLKSTLSASDLGDVVNAQAPNIKGKFLSAPACTSSETTDYHNQYWTEAFKDSYPANSPFGNRLQAGSSYGGILCDFNANNSNSIYKDSATTIDPDAVKVYYYIVLGTVSKTDIQIDIDQVLTDLNGKADKDLSNATPTSAFATILNNAQIRTVVETYVNGTSWYRVYSDNWCEQGGITNATANGTSVALLKAYANTDYNGFAQNAVNTYRLDQNASEISFIPSLTTACTIYSGINAGVATRWFACGYIS